MIDFIRQVAPIAESYNVFMAIHPDDPPISLLGLPRIVSTASDVRKILSKFDFKLILHVQKPTFNVSDAYPSPHNGLTMCVGSYASRSDNNVEEIVKEFAQAINFVHLRNVQKEGDGFVESEHLGGDVDMFDVITSLLLEQKRRKKIGVKHEGIPHWQ